MSKSYQVVKADNSSITNKVFINNTFSHYIKVTKNNNFGIFLVDDNSSLNNNSIIMTQLQRTYFKIELNDTVLIEAYNKELTEHKEITFIIERKTNKNKIVIDEKMYNSIKLDLMHIPIIKGMKYYSNNLIFTSALEDDYIKIIDEDTIINFIVVCENVIVEFNNNETKSIFKSEFNFKELGIGGLDKQFEVIFRRAFASRAIPNKICKDLGINHVRGILLYGVPGCGKTLIARQIGKILNCEEPKIVNGPSLLSKFHGESEENVRKLFEDAIADTYNSKLHLIICDEFDALARKRGSGGTSDLNDKIVNQFLTMIDGPKSLNNILLICMTNRKDLLDDAIMRPGRLEVQIEVSLPDEKGRFDILTIHTDKMLKNGYTSNLNLEEIAKLSINFTGAEIESIIKNAVSYSISRELDVSNLANAKNIKPQITQEDLIRSFKEIKPLFGSLSNEIGIITSKEFELYSDNYKYVYDDITNIIKQNKKGKIVSFLIHGDYFVGKTTLACNIMKDSNISCIKFINSEKLVNSYLKDQTIYEIFDSGHKLETLGIILNSVEKIIEYSKLGHQYNNKILQVIYTILDKVIENNKSVYIILTSSNSELMDILDFTKICHNSYELLDEYEISKQFRENI
jgi:vesicle-fusing ATPase